MTITKRHKIWLLSALAIAIGTLTLLSAGLSQLELLPGRSLPIQSILQTFDGWRTTFSGIHLPAGFLAIFTVITWLMFVIFIIALIISPEFRKEALQKAAKYFVMLLIIYWLLQELQNLALLKSENSGETAAEILPWTPIPAEGLPTPPTFVIDPPPWFVFTISLILISLFLGLIWFFWQRLHPNQPEAENTLELLTEEVQQALAQLQMGSDLKDTVIRCYHEMSQTLGKQRGLQRQRTMTPREFEQHLAKSGLSDEHIQRLTRLFERVRYGAKTTGEPEEQEAIACLTAIVQVYGGSS